MDEKYYSEKLRFLTEILKTLVSILVAIVAGVIVLFGRDVIRPVDWAAIYVGLFFAVCLIVFIFIFGFDAVDVLNKLKTKK